MQTLYGSEEHSEEVCTIEVDPLPIDVAGRSLTLSPEPVAPGCLLSSLLVETTVSWDIG